MTCTLPDSLYDALQERLRTENAGTDHIVCAALAGYLGKPIHTLFQVSTSAALVEGLYQGAVRVSRLLRHGDFGIGTFIDLDGEMVVLDGICYQVLSSGAVAIIEGDPLVPYAVVTRFKAEFRKEFQKLNSFGELTAVCDELRDSNNIFYAFKVDGRFSLARTRVMRAVSEGTKLLAASSAQEEFGFQNVDGTLVGLWSPGFAGSFSVPGYHFHFLSADHQKGGHVLECKVSDVVVAGCAMNEMHVSLPETEEFLKADLDARDPQADLVKAERTHES